MMGIVAEKSRLDVRGMKVSVGASFVSEPVTRIGSFTVTVTLPRKFSGAQQARLRKAVVLCPVHNTLHPDVAVRIPMRCKERRT